VNQALEALHEFGQSRIAFWVDPPRGQCEWEAGCTETDAILHATDDGTELCASHYRQQSVRDTAYPCDNCGHKPAFRDPLARKNEMFCNDCHARNGYIPGERAMINKVTARVGVTHPMARHEKCILANKGTECAGEVKQRSDRGVMCNKHADPVKWLKGRPA
jgi:hypothetical protein